MKWLQHWFGRLLTAGWRPARTLLAWIGQHDLGVLATVLLVAVSVWGFAELADEVGDGATQRFDEWAVRVMRRTDDLARPVGPRWLEEAGRDATALGGIFVLTLLVAAVAGFLWLTRAYRSLGIVLASTLSGMAVSFLLKGLFDRPRPAIVPHLSHVSTASFPSGHSMMSAIVFLTLGAVLAEAVESRVLKAYFLLVAAVLSALVGVSRVFLGVHYPTDVLGGWVAGLAWALGCGLVARFFHRPDRPEILAPLPERAASARSLDR